MLNLSSKQKQSVRKASIHRVLAIRLAITAAIISLLLSVIVILTERGKVGEVVLDRALQGAAHFSIQAGYLLDKPGLPEDADSLIYVSN
ncbi:MAG: hypothetical protein MRK01_13450 [Candidatus Scalindua sp.]|nr:hypothetical protein [Candidatus Scalindua sp.]